MRVNKYTATLITFFLSAVVHELGKAAPCSPKHLTPLPTPLAHYHRSDLALTSHVGVIQKVTWLPALLANAASTSSPTE